MVDTKSIEVGRDYLIINGRPVFIFGGDFNYTRTPSHHWRDRLLKLKAAGMNTVTFYLTWAFHEPEKGKWQWQGDKDVAAFLDLIKELGLYAIVRLGPFIHGEWRNGGLPQWLVDELGLARVRSNDPEYLRYTKLWYEQELKIIVPRLITRGGPIITIQLENELGSAGSKGDDIHRGSSDPEENAKHVLHYYQIVKQSGVDVPVIDINHWPGKEENIKELVDTGGGYPASCFGNEGEIPPIDQTRWEKHQRPYITIETGAGMFVRFYDLPPYRNTSGYQGPIIKAEHIEAYSLGLLAEGANGIGYYILVDGQHPKEANERMLPSIDMNYQAPVTVAGTLRPSYKSIKRLGWLLRSFEQEMLKTQPNYSWATVHSYGKSHPGLEQTTDLFQGYHTEGVTDNAELRHIKKVDSAGRCTKGLNLSESNFLILRNTKIHGSQWLRDVRIETCPRGIPCETFREYPNRTQMTIAPQENKILPFYIRVQPGTFIEYSTASILDRRPFGKDGTQVILYADANSSIETAVVTESKCDVIYSGETLPLWESPNTVTMISRPGAFMNVNIFKKDQPFRLVIMDTKLAGNVWDVASPQGPVVACSNLYFIESTCKDRTTFATVQSREEDIYLCMLAPFAPRFKGKNIQIEGTYDPEFEIFKGQVTIHAPEIKIQWSKRREANTLIWEAKVNRALLNGIEDVVFTAKYNGACGRAYIDNTLISDHYFGRFMTWEVTLADWIKGDGLLRLEFEDTHEVDLRIVPVINSYLEIEWC